MGSLKYKICELLNSLLGGFCKGRYEEKLKLTQANLADCLDGKQLLLDKVEEYRIEIVKLWKNLNAYTDHEPVPETNGTVSINSLKSLFSGKCKSLFLSDTSYKLILYDSMKDFLAWDRTD